MLLTWAGYGCNTRTSPPVLLCFLHTLLGISLDTVLLCTVEFTSGQSTFTCLCRLEALFLLYFWGDQRWAATYRKGTTAVQIQYNRIHLPATQLTYFPTLLHADCLLAVCSVLRGVPTSPLTGPNPLVPQCASAHSCSAVRFSSDA